MTSPLSMFPRDPWKKPERPPEFEDQPPEIRIGNRIRYKLDNPFNHGNTIGVVKAIYWSVSKRWCVTFLYEHVYYKPDGARHHQGGGHEFASEVEVDLLDRLANEA